MKKILELILCFTLASLSVTIYTFYVITSLKEQITRMTLPTTESNLEDLIDATSYDSDFDDRIREMTAELEKLNAPGSVYDLPHSAVRTPSKFSPEYAD